MATSGRHSILESWLSAFSTTGWTTVVTWAALNQATRPEASWRSSVADRAII
jgi:hypothetical protein